VWTVLIRGVDRKRRATDPAFFPQLPEIQFTNLPMMGNALRSAGLQAERTQSWPQKGLVLLCGPERYYSRHWIAVCGDFLYEVSLDTWLPSSVWRRDFLPELANQFSCLALPVVAQFRRSPNP
jgi:hypothetical protein